MTDLLKIDFRGAAARLEDVDIPAIGATIGVSEDELHAVMDVEARSSGFDRHGRPAMLFERHIFWRELGPGRLRDEAYRRKLAVQHWVNNYPTDSYTRLRDAMLLLPDAALRSASWGLGQIMGFNCKLAGYESAHAMVAAFLDSEKEQLAAMVRFIKAAGLAGALRKHDWAAFALGCNGPGYATHGYHTRLKARYEWWANVPDTPWSLASMGCDCPARETP